jgi:hypothetical protein
VVNCVLHVPVQRQYSRKLAVVPERHEAPSPRATDQTATRRQKHGSLTPPADIFSRNGNTRGSFFPNVEKPEDVDVQRKQRNPDSTAKKDKLQKKQMPSGTKQLVVQPPSPCGTETAPHVARQLRHGPALSTSCLSYQAAAAVTQCSHRLSTNLGAIGRTL